MKLLVTGGAGFIGSNFIRYVLSKHAGWHVVNMDKLTYAGNLENLRDVENSTRYEFVKGDIADARLVDGILKKDIDAVVNFAAESHVDRSIMDASPFIETNIAGTQALLDGARRHKVKRFVQISTDEVYGSLGAKGRFCEESPLAPNSPYAASKAAADLLCRACHHTYDMPVIITRSSNNYGPYQFPEKLIPLVITNAVEGVPIPVYGDGLNVRDWLYVEDNCRAINLVLQKGNPGEVYNIGGGCEVSNIELVKTILSKLKKPHSLIEYVKDRPGHDRRYALDCGKLEKELKCSQAGSMDTALDKTIAWYLDNAEWWKRVKSGDYQAYYKKQYKSR
ncbi:MAG: dTDP-glucose 4,6-dehydratase [Dehalococcoidia bacterium]|jgi:dTDP-glucose 4,6-dehydratase